MFKSFSYFKQLSLYFNNFKCFCSHNKPILYNITESGIYGWGNSDRGQLGQGSNISNISTIKKLKLSSIPYNEKYFSYAIAQEDGSIFIIRKDNKNKFYGVGNGFFGVSGFETDEPIFEPIEFTIKEENNSLFNSDIKQVAVGRFHVLYKTECGDLYISGSSRQGQIGLGSDLQLSIGPIHVPFTSKIKYISGGCFHSMAITNEGDLYSWGANLCYQLGHGDGNPRFTPHLVEDFPSIKTGDTNIFHTIIVDDDNVLYGWGQNKSGQLGDTKTNVSIIHPIEIPHNIQNDIISIKCGDKHNLLLTDKGDVYAFGDNTYSQMGKPLTITRQNIPSIIPLLQGKDIDEILAIREQSYAISRKNGTVYAWGYAPNYQFGISKANWVEPQQIVQLDNNLYIKNISTGGLHSWLIIEEKEI